MLPSKFGTMSGYPYTPLKLPGNSIRLLRINKGKWINDIECELIETFMGPENGCPYKALSYTWGGLDHTPCQTRLRINGLEVSVKESLYTAVHHIRCSDQDVYLWVDALCINQDDNEEKSSQVNQMGDIYKAAEEVIVWLGPSAVGIGDLFDLITTTDDQAAKLHKAGDRDSWDALCRRQTRGLLDISKHMPALRRLLERDWFRRVWIIQEVSLAKTATVRCGFYTCPARTFAWMPSLIGLDVNEQTQAVLDIMPRFRKNTWWSSKRYLHFLLEKFRDSESSRSRDKIYALLSISEDAHDPKRFYPCYEKSDAEVFRDTGSFLVFGEVLGTEYSLPELTLQELHRPVIQLAEKILDWTLGYKEGQQREATQRTAMSLVNRLNEGQLKTPDLLLSLAGKRGKVGELRDLLDHGDVWTGVELEDERDTLTVFSHASGTATVRLEFASTRESSDKPIQAHPLPLPFQESENMEATIQDLKLADGPKDALLRAYVWKGDKDAVQGLLDDGVDVNTADKNGCAALHLASHKGWDEILELLCAYGADVNQVDIDGNSPLLYATRGAVKSH